MIEEFAVPTWVHLLLRMTGRHLRRSTGWRRRRHILPHVLPSLASEPQSLETVAGEPANTQPLASSKHTVMEPAAAPPRPQDRLTQRFLEAALAMEQRTRSLVTSLEPVAKTGKEAEKREPATPMPAAPVSAEPQPGEASAVEPAAEVPAAPASPAVVASVPMETVPVTEPQESHEREPQEPAMSEGPAEVIGQQAAAAEVAPVEMAEQEHPRPSEPAASEDHGQRSTAAHATSGNPSEAALSADEVEVSVEEPLSEQVPLIAAAEADETIAEAAAMKSEPPSAVELPTGDATTAAPPELEVAAAEGTLQLADAAQAAAPPADAEKAFVAVATAEPESSAVSEVPPPSPVETPSAVAEVTEIVGEPRTEPELATEPEREAEAVPAAEATPAAALPVPTDEAPPAVAPVPTTGTAPAVAPAADKIAPAAPIDAAAAAIKSAAATVMAPAVLDEYNRTGLDFRRPMPRPKVRGLVIDWHCHLMSRKHAEDWFEAADHYGINVFLTMTPLEEATALARDYGRRLRFIAVPKWGDNEDGWVDRWRSRIEAFYNLGSRIAKFHASPGTMVMRGHRLDSPVYAPLFAELKDRGMAIMTHIGDPDTWYHGRYSDPSKFGTREEHYQMWERLLEQHRGTPWVGAHLGGNPEDLPRLQRLLDRFPDLWLDCSATRWMVREISARREPAREFFIRNQDRILFGSDQVSGDDRHFDFLASRFWCHRKLWETAYIGPSPIIDPDLPKDQQPQLRGLALPDVVLQKIYHDNPTKLLARIGMSFEQDVA